MFGAVVRFGRGDVVSDLVSPNCCHFCCRADYPKVLPPCSASISKPPDIGATFRRAPLSFSTLGPGLGSLAGAQAGAPDQPPHNGDGDRAEGEIAAGQDEVEVGNPAPWLIAQGFHKVVLRRAVAVP